MAESPNAPASQLPAPQASEASDTLVGQILNGRFKVLERIGAGGMGRVYKALQAPLDREVALKVLNPGYAVEQDPAFAKRFFLEASVSAKLTHPNSITIFDYGRTDDGVFFIAMEYLHGRTLHQVIAAEGCLVAPRAVHIARQICRALREAHGLGIVHRDLKPANVMLLHHGDDEDFVKVLDFGLVKFFGADSDKNGEGDGGELTQGGVFLGSPTYMAPEQARNESDPRSDVYSLGVVLYHMLAGRPPFQGKAPVDIILKHVNDTPPPFRHELKVPPDLEAVVMRALSKAPEDRYASMEDFLDALKRLGTLSPSDLMLSSSIPSGPARPPPPIRPPSRPTVRSGPRVGTPVAPGSPGVATPRAGAPFHLSQDAWRDDDDDDGGRSRWRGPLLGGAAAIVAAAAALGVVLALRPEPARPPDATAARPPAATVPAHGPVQRSLHVESVPPGANVSWNGRALGQTPLDVRIAAGELPPTLSLEAPGFAPAQVTATRQGDGLLARATLTALPPPPQVDAPTPRAEHHTHHVHAKPPTSKPAPAPSGYKDDPYQ